MASKAAVREDGADLGVEVDLRIAFRLSPCSVGASRDEQGCPGQAAGAGKPFGAGEPFCPGHRYGIDAGRRRRTCEREKPIHGDFFFAGAEQGRDESGSKAVRLSTCILFGMVSGVSVAFSKRRISSAQNYENNGKVANSNRRFPDRTDSGKIA